MTLIADDSLLLQMATTERTPEEENAMVEEAESVTIKSSMPVASEPKVIPPPSCHAPIVEPPCPCSAVPVVEEKKIVPVVEPVVAVAPAPVAVVHSGAEYHLDSDDEEYNITSKSKSAAAITGSHSGAVLFIVLTFVCMLL